MYRNSSLSIVIGSCMFLSATMARSGDDSASVVKDAPAAVAPVSGSQSPSGNAVTANDTATLTDTVLARSKGQGDVTFSADLPPQYCDGSSGRFQGNSTQTVEISDGRIKVVGIDRSTYSCIESAAVSTFETTAALRDLAVDIQANAGPIGLIVPPDIKNAPTGTVLRVNCTATPCATTTTRITSGDGDEPVQTSDKYEFMFVRIRDAAAAQSVKEALTKLIKNSGGGDAQDPVFAANQDRARKEAAAKLQAVADKQQQCIASCGSKYPSCSGGDGDVSTSVAAASTAAALASKTVSTAIGLDVFGMASAAATEECTGDYAECLKSCD